MWKALRPPCTIFESEMLEDKTVQLAPGQIPAPGPLGTTAGPRTWREP